MTTTKAKNLTAWVGIDRYMEGREAASQTFKAGDPLLIDSSGNVAIAAASGSNITNAVKLAGVAMEDATGTTNNKIRVGIIGPRTRWKIPVSHATPASAVTALTNNDETFVIKNDATVGWCLLLSTTTNACARQVEICGDNAVGELNGMVLASIPGDIDSDVTYSRLEN
jgi:hypothetical protein